MLRPLLRIVKPHGSLSPSQNLKPRLPKLDGFVASTPGKAKASNSCDEDVILSKSIQALRHFDNVI
jgi:hypothetical protein